jgi:serine/threonine protein kinase
VACEEGLREGFFSDGLNLYQEQVGTVTMDDFDLDLLVQRSTQRPVQLHILTDAKKKESVMQAVEGFRKLNHTNIVRVLYAFVRDPGDRATVVVSERVGISFGLFLAGIQSWTEVIVTAIARQIIAGLAIIHESQLVYASLSPQSLLIRPAEPGGSGMSLKLGFSEVMHPVGSKGYGAALGVYGAPEKVSWQASDMFRWANNILNSQFFVVSKTFSTVLGCCYIISCLDFIQNVHWKALICQSPLGTTSLTKQPFW